MRPRQRRRRRHENPSNQIASQVEIHARYGGVVPEVASRQHILSIIPILEQAMLEAKVGLARPERCCRDQWPRSGRFAAGRCQCRQSDRHGRGLPLIGVNHLEGHIYANWLTGQRILFPVLCLIVSGGHSDLVLMKDHGNYYVLGRTRDDAAGEAFDKAARILGLGYPGGPAIDKAAQGGAPNS